MLDPGPQRRRASPAARLGVAVALAACTLAVYWPVRHAGFLDYDDAPYVTANAHVQRGLTVDGLAWAFTTDAMATWHPLTWISHMAVVSVAGLDPAAHHLANVALHALATSVLFAVLADATRAPWPSALVALLFALHPLHVESVAWVAERKDVLSTCFGFLALAAYVAYARHPTSGRLALVGLAYAASLLAKSMLVTLPVVLLLLDWWPLRRLASARDARALVGEKLPLAALAAAIAGLTVVTQRHQGSVSGLDAVPLAYRLGHALVSYLHYLMQSAWPAGLAVFYPYPHATAWPRVALAACTLVAVSAGAWRVRDRAPWVLVGWLWFLVTLLPVIGIVQIGMQAWADRYTYVPLVGLAIVLAWTLDALAHAGPPALRRAIVTVAIIAVAACAAATRAQLRYWRDDVALFRHALAVTSDNFLAHNNLGRALVSGTPANRAEALAHFREAVRLRPAYPEAHNNLGGLLFLDGRRDEAIAEFEEALRLQPDFTAARNNLRVAQAARAGEAAR